MKLVPWRRKREVGSALAPIDQPLSLLRDQMESVLERFMRDPFAWPWEQADEDLIAMPRTDLADTADAVTVTMELPGVNPDAVDVEISGDVLTVRGEKRSDREEKQKNYHYVERQFGGFQRSIRLPSGVDADDVDASFKDGVLTIRVGKSAGAKPKTVKVRTE
ncbi:MAG: Spore protein SP21 [Phycisphaerae bacterium]|nr:Spore protein SP21 [Phycisphaerae bacterium]